MSNLSELASRLTLDAPEWLALLLLLIPMWWAAGRRTFQGRTARWAALVRTLLVIVIALAAAGLTLKVPATRLGVVFVLDRSASLPEQARSDALAFVQEASKAMRDGDRAAVVVVGDGAMVELEPTDELRLGAVESRVSPHQTDLAAGIRLAEAVMPSDYTRRIVVLSDGEETRGDAISQAASAAEDVELWTVAYDRAEADEVLLEGITAPDQVAEGAVFELRVVARALRPTRGILHLYRNERLLGSLPVELTGGRADLFVLRQEADEPGFLRYRATLEVEGGVDAVPQNNVAVTTVAVEGRPRILYVEGKAGQSQHLQRVLEEEGMAVDVISPGEMSASLAALQPYSAVLLSDVPAYALTERQMEVLRRYVRDLGRGFAMFGGDESFGVGGYYKTPIEDILPVRMDIQDKKYFPSLSMAMAIDKSGSMGGTGRAEKMGMAKEAAIQTAELMADRDRLGIITFDGAASWAVPMTTLTQRSRIIDTISKLQAGGGTHIYPALKEAYGALNRETSAQKHIILMSDGVTMGGDFEALIRMGQRRDITLTAIAIGDDSDRYSMESWAKWGGGRYYLVTRPEHIPRVFTREAMLATRSFLMEETFQPTLGAPSPVTRGLGSVVLPTLGGYVATEIKPRATIAMYAREDENTPLLATWRHGLGRTAAWTSDCKARWARNWIGTEAYTRTFTQMVRWLAASEGSADVQAHAELDRGVMTVTVDVYDADGGFRNFLEGEARFIGPDLTVQTRPLQQVAPGRYRATIDATQDGAHLVGVFLHDAEGNAVAQTTAEAAQPYSPEYRPASGGKALLAEISRLGRGIAVVDQPPSIVFTPPSIPRLVPHPLWPPLLVLACLILLIDVAVRRLDWSFLRRRPAPVVVTEVYAPLPPAPRARPTRTPAREIKRPPEVSAAARERAVGNFPEELPVEPIAPPEPEQSAYLGGLLEARRRARDRHGGGKS
jgi:Mg-chelatase subunit ChlD